VRPFVVVQDIYDPMESKFQADLFLRGRCGAKKPVPIPAPNGASILGVQAVLPAGYSMRPSYGAYSDFDIIRWWQTSWLQLAVRATRMRAGARSSATPHRNRRSRNGKIFLQVAPAI